MRVYPLPIFLFFLLVLPACRKPVSPKPPPSGPTEGKREAAISTLRKATPYFIKNEGQIDGPAKYYVKGRRGMVYLTPGKVIYDFVREKEGAEEKKKEEKTLSRREQLRRLIEEDKEFERVVFSMKFEGANDNPEVTGDKELPGKINYYIGSDQNRWKAGIPTFEEVRYKDIYDGISLSFHFKDGTIGYSFDVQPGADPKNIVLRYEGVEGLDIGANGYLVVRTRFGDFTEKSPQVYQDIAGARVPVGGRFELKGANRVGFDIPLYDLAQPLIIDQALNR